MQAKNVDIAEKYYTFMGEKNIEAIEKFLHPEVELLSPFALVEGKEAVLKASENYVTLFKKLNIRKKFGGENQAVLIQDLEIPGMEELFRAAVLITFQEELIIKIELFYDTAPLVAMRDKIFS